MFDDQSAFLHDLNDKIEFPKTDLKFILVCCIDSVGGDDCVFTVEVEVISLVSDGYRAIYSVIFNDGVAKNVLCRNVNEHKSARLQGMACCLNGFPKRAFIKNVTENRKDTHGHIKWGV